MPIVVGNSKMPILDYSGLGTLGLKEECVYVSSEHTNNVRRACITWRLSSTRTVL